MGPLLVQLQSQPPGAIIALAAVSASFGAIVMLAIAHFAYRRRTQHLRAELARLKDQKARRLEEFERLAPRQERVSPPMSPPVGGDTDVTDRMRADRSD